VLGTAFIIKTVLKEWNAIPEENVSLNIMTHINVLDANVILMQKDGAGHKEISGVSRSVIKIESGGNVFPLTHLKSVRYTKFTIFHVVWRQVDVAPL
jgi:hypothetical protein